MKDKYWIVELTVPTVVSAEDKDAACAIASSQLHQ